MKKVSLALIIIGTLLIIAALCLHLFRLAMYDTPGSGTIGGSDTPTYSYIFRKNLSLNGALFSAGIILELCGIFRLIFPEAVKQCCSIKTTLTSVAASALSVTGIVFFALAHLSLLYGERTETEIQTVRAGITLFVLSFVCLLIYVILRVKKPSFKGTAIDFLLALITVPFWIFFSDLLLSVIL